MIYTISNMLSEFKEPTSEPEKTSKTTELNLFGINFSDLQKLKKQAESKTLKTEPKTEQDLIKNFEQFAKSLFEKYKNVAYGADYQRVKEGQLRPDEYLAALFRLAYSNQLSSKDLKDIMTKTWSLIPYLEKMKLPESTTESKTGIKTREPEETQIAWTKKAWTITPVDTTALAKKSASFTDQVRKAINDLTDYYINELLYSKYITQEKPQKPEILFKIDELPSNFKEILEKEINAKIEKLAKTPSSMGFSYANPTWADYRSPELLESWKNKLQSELLSKLSGIATGPFLPEFYSLADLFEGLKQRIQVPTSILVSNLLRAKQSTSNMNF